MCVHRTTFSRQAANLWKVKERLWQELLAETPHDRTFAICDSLPLPACLFARAYRCRRFKGEATFGKDTLLRQTFYGFRVHVRVWLAPDEAFDPTNPHPGAVFLPISTFSNFRPAVPGRYEFSLILSTQSQYPEQWLGSFGQDAERSAVLERIAQVPRLTIRSNVLEVEVL
jgi:hypothetical protein